MLKSFFYFLKLASQNIIRSKFSLNLIRNIKILKHIKSMIKRKTKNILVWIEFDP